MPRARATASTSPAPPPSTAATVQVRGRPRHYGRQHDLHHPQRRPAACSGTYAGVTSNFAFLTPSLTYDANNVFLTLALQGNAFSGFGGNTVNQRAVGYALDQSFASATRRLRHGDRCAGRPQHDPGAGGARRDQRPAICRLRHDQRRQRVAVHEHARPADGQCAQRAARRAARVALAQACEVEACDDARPLSAWFSGLGGLGSVQGNGNSSTLTYNFGGAAAGLDYRFDPRFLVGLGVGYTHGTQWVNSFMGQGWSDSFSVAAYGSFTPWSGGLLRRCAGRLRLLQQPDAAADPDPRPAAAHGVGQHRRQPVPGAGRGRLQARRLGHDAA